MSEEINKKEKAPLAVDLQRLVSFAQWIPIIGLFLAPTISNFSKYKSIIDDHYVSSLAWHMVTFGISLGLLLKVTN